MDDSRDDTRDMHNELRVWRARRRVSQVQLAKAAGMGLTQTRVSRFETGLEQPTPEQRAALARALETTEAELFPAVEATV